MNSLCRRAAAYLVGGNLQHLSTDMNPTDKLSRWFGEDFLRKLPPPKTVDTMGAHIRHRFFRAWCFKVCDERSSTGTL